MGKPITVFLKDTAVITTLPDFKSACAEIRQLLTLSFHPCRNSTQKLFFAMEVAEQYANVGEKVDQLIDIVGQFSATPIKGVRSRPIG